MAVAKGTTQGWTADDSAFGARLALIRQRMGWGNVKEAAVACHLPTESWRTWERDNVIPRRLVDVAMQIAGTVGCDLDWLIRGPRGGTEHTTWYPATRIVKVAQSGTPAPVRAPVDAGRRPVLLVRS